MRDWEEHDFEQVIRAILENSVYETKPEHHLGRPFMSPYQIAIELDKQNPSIAQSMKLKIGGKNSGTQVSLSQYIGQQLSARIGKGEITDMEGGFISNKYLKEISYKYAEKIIISSATDGKYDLSVFRLTTAPVNKL